MSDYFLAQPPREYHIDLTKPIPQWMADVYRALPQIELSMKASPMRLRKVTRKAPARGAQS